MPAVPYTRRSAGIWSTNDLMRQAKPSSKLKLSSASQAETSYKRLVQDQLAGGPAKKADASGHWSAHRSKSLKEDKLTTDHKLLTSALRYVIGSRPTHNLRRKPHPDKTKTRPTRKYRPTQTLNFHRSIRPEAVGESVRDDRR